MSEDNMQEIAVIINQILENPEDETSISEAREKALALCAQFPLPY